MSKKIIGFVMILEIMACLSIMTNASIDSLVKYVKSIPHQTENVSLLKK
jgi:hypothetical protein